MPSKIPPDKIPPEPKPRQKIGSFRDVLTTHHVKLFSTSIPLSARLIDLSCLTKSLSAATGIHSASIEGDYPLTIASNAPGIGVANELGSDAEQPVHGNALNFALAKNSQALIDIGYGAACRASLIDQVSDLEAFVPNEISRHQKQFFFETETDCILMTPMVSAKTAAELTARLTDREKAAKETKRPQNELAPRALRLSFGGSNPQNAGNIVASTSRSTRRGYLPTLVISPPRRRSDAISILVSRVAGAKTLTKAIRLEKDDLSLYARRSIVDINLAKHKDDEKAHAKRLVSLFLDVVKTLRVHFGSSPNLLNSSPAFTSFPKDELALLDPRCGAFDAQILAAKFANGLRLQIERSLPPPFTDDGENRAFKISDRSYSALRAAFETALTCI